MKITDVECLILDQQFPFQVGYPEMPDGPGLGIEPDDFGVKRLAQP